MNIFSKLFGRRDKKAKLPEKIFPIQRKSFSAGGKSFSNGGLYKSNSNDDYPIHILPSVFNSDTPSSPALDNNSFNASVVAIEEEQELRIIGAVHQTRVARMIRVSVTIADRLTVVALAIRVVHHQINAISYDHILENLSRPRRHMVLGMQADAGWHVRLPVTRFGCSYLYLRQRAKENKSHDRLGRVRGGT